MLEKFRTVWPAVLTTLALGLPSAVAAAPAQAIEGGGIVTDQVDWVVGLDLRDVNNKQVATCTGSLISSTYVLAAGHCAPSIVKSVDVLVRRKGLGYTQHFTSKRIVRSDAGDVSLIELTEPVTGMTFPKFSTMHENAQSVIYGVGRTAPDNKETSSSSWPDKKYANQTIVGEMHNQVLASTWEKISKTFYKGLFLNRVIIGESDTGHAAPGDSGGPMMQYGAIVGVGSRLGFFTTMRWYAGFSNTAGTSLYQSLAPVHDWILTETKLTDAAVSADYPTATLANVDILGKGRWLESKKQEDGSYAAKLADSGANKPTFDLLFDSTGAFQIRGANGKCLTLNSRAYVTDAGLNAFANQTTFDSCDYLDAKQKFALKNPVASNGGRPQYSIVNSTTRLALIASGSEVQVSQTDSDSMIIQSESGTIASALAGYAAQRASTPNRPKRDTGSAATTSMVLNVPGKGKADLPKLPSGVIATVLQTSTNNGKSTTYALGDDQKLYVTSSLPSNNLTFAAWTARPQAGITQVVPATSDAGAVYTDGSSVYSTETGKLPALPDPTNVEQISMARGAGNTTLIWVLGTNGVLYRSVNGGAWVAWDKQVSTIAVSETDTGMVYVVNGQVRYVWPSGGAYLPLLPAGVGVGDVRVSQENGNTYVYVLGLDGKVYVSQAVTKTPKFSAWTQLQGEGVLSLRTSTTSGNAVYTDGKSVYATLPSAVTLPALPGVTVVGAAAADQYTYVLTTDGKLLSNTRGQSGWQEVAASSASLDYFGVSQTDGAAAFITHPR